MSKGYYETALQISQERKFVKRNFTTTPSNTGAYYKYRVLRPLLKAYTVGLRFPQGDKPWLSPTSIDILSAILDKEMTMLEYGSGRSTLFFAEKVKNLTSVEHHHQWYSNISQQIRESGLENIDYQLIEPDEKLETKKEIENRFKAPYNGPLANYNSYYNFVNRFKDESFDVILIDGRARVECTINSLSKLKDEGILILDNAERERYKPIHEMCAGMKKVNTTTGLTDTTFWFK